VPHPVIIRDAAPFEAGALEDLQRRASDVWEQFRERLAAHPDAIELPAAFIENGWVRLATSGDGTLLGFSVVIPSSSGAHELDGLFVEPWAMGRGVGRALVEDAATSASAVGAEALEVTAGPAQGFYQKVGFVVSGVVQTRFAPAVRMRRELV
jgi:GNAT superfamily N-acetyltransferase